MYALTACFCSCRWCNCRPTLSRYQTLHLFWPIQRSRKSEPKHLLHQRWLSSRQSSLFIFTSTTVQKRVWILQSHCYMDVYVQYKRKWHLLQGNMEKSNFSSKTFYILGCILCQNSNADQTRLNQLIKVFKITYKKYVRQVCYLGV